MRKFLLLAFLMFAPLCKAQTVVPIVGGFATINMNQPNAGNSFKIFVTGAVTVNVSGQPTYSSSFISIIFTQDGSGHAVTFGTRFSAGSAPVISTTASSTTTVSFQYDGTSNLLYGITAQASGGGATGTAGGDLSGTYPNPVVAQVNGAVVPTSASVVGSNSSKQLIAASAGSILSACTGCAPLASPTFTGTVTAPLRATTTNCIANGTAASPSVAACGASSAGMFSCDPAATTATCQVNTTAVTANSEILIIETAADGGASQLNVTCNTALVTPSAKPILLSKSTGVSFTINLGTVTANPGCFEYVIIN